MDEEGNLWVVTGENQLYKGNLYFQKLETSVSDIRAIIKFQDQMFVGNESGLFIRDGYHDKKISNDNITFLAKLDSFLLVGTFSQGIKVYNTKFILIDQVSTWAGISKQSILSLYSTKNKLFASSLSGVMTFEFLDGRLIPSQSMNPILGNSYIYTMLSTGNQYFFGTDRNGLIVWDEKEDEISHITTFGDGDKIGSVYALSLDKKQKVWFTSSEQGLGFLDEGQANSLDILNNISDEYTSLSTLATGDIMALRSESIEVINPETMHSMSFDQEIGLKDQVSFLNTVCHDGITTYFVNDKNIYSYTPSRETKIHPDVIIDDILVNLSKATGKYSFKQEENNIEFNFSGSWLTDPNKLTYQYKLIGFDNDWRRTKDRSVAYPKLDPGHYQFILRASENGRFVDEPSKTYAFEITRNWYNTTWAKVTFLLLSALLIWKFVQIREARKKERLALEKLNIENQLINLKNQLNPHFLFNAFNTLVGLIEEDSDRSLSFVERMTDFYRNMLEFGKKDLITLSKEFEILQQYIDILKARFNGQLMVEIQKDDYPESYLIPSLTLQLLVENAVKHNVVSSKTPLNISIDQSADQITVQNIKQPLLGKVKGTETGLKNISSRFALVDLPKPIVENDKAFFKVTLYLKTKK